MIVNMLHAGQFVVPHRTNCRTISLACMVARTRIAIIMPSVFDTWLSILADRMLYAADAWACRVRYPKIYKSQKSGKFNFPSCFPSCSILSAIQHYQLSPHTYIKAKNRVKSNLFHPPHPA